MPTGKAQAAAALSVSPSPSAEYNYRQQQQMLPINLKGEREVVGIEMQCHTEKNNRRDTWKCSDCPHRQSVATVSISHCSWAGLQRLERSKDHRISHKAIEGRKPVALLNSLLILQTSGLPSNSAITSPIFRERNVCLLSVPASKWQVEGISKPDSSSTACSLIPETVLLSSRC